MAPAPQRLVGRSPDHPGLIRSTNVSIRKVGGLWFIRIGRLGASFYITRKAR